MQPRVFNIKDVDKPSDCVYIGRGSPYGNPFVIGKDGNRKEVIKKYIEYIEDNHELKALIKEELKDKNLVCFCKPLACHGDYLLLISNFELE